MTTFHTGNPVPSNSIKDLFDNAENLDFAVNDQLREEWLDRLGRRRVTLLGVERAFQRVVDRTEGTAATAVAGIRAEAAQVVGAARVEASGLLAEISAELESARLQSEAILAAMGYLVPVAYVEGLLVDSARMTVEHEGAVYAPLPSSLPFTAEQDFDTSKWRLIQGVAASDVTSIVTDSGLVLNIMPSASGDAVTDTRRLQAALGRGGIVYYGNPGTYLWNEVSVVNSHTGLIALPGVTFKQDPSSRSPFLINRGYSAARKTVASMVVAPSYVDPDKSHSGINSYVSVSCTAHGYRRGDFVALTGAQEFGYDGVMRVSSVVNANTFVVETNVPVVDSVATPSLWAGSLSVSAADTNILIDVQGELDYNYQNLTSPIPPGPLRLYTMGVVIYGAVNSSVSIRRCRNVAKYGVLAANVRNLDVPRINFDTHSDGLHLQPPYAGVRIGTLSGTTGDDLLSLTGGDFSSYEISRGHGYDLKIDHLMPQNALTALKITGNAPYKFWDVEIGTISGSTILQVLSLIRDQNLTHTDIGRLRVGSIRVKAQTTEEFRMTMDSIEDFSIGDLCLMGAPPGRSVMPMGRATSYASRIGKLVIERLSFAEAGEGRTVINVGYNTEIGSVSVGLHGISYVGTSPLTVLNIEGGQPDGSPSGSVDTATIRGKVQAATANGRLVRQAGRLGTLFVSELDYRRGENVLHQVEGCSGLPGTNETRMFVDCLHLWETQLLARATGKLRVCFGSNYLQTPQPPLNAAVSGAELVVEGCAKGSFSRATTKSAGAAVYVDDPRIRVDVVNHVTPRKGDSARNINSGFEYGECQVRYNGTRWVRDEANDGVQVPSNAGATSYNPDWSQGRTFRIPSLTQGVTFYGPNEASRLIPGDRVVFVITQDGVGGRTLQWTADYYKFAVPFSLAGNLPGRTTTIEFVYDGQYLISGGTNVWV
ncbi:hypothetical protein [Stenotrophomonas sp. LM091]|uniref:hypothetical protein n=1 Tax=Stenotrophomonas sp. LM091 TaxID=1904944 RepID=UPI0012E9AF89|nr:hypothetical protein [Stenotrophomonas sp. LM091]